MNANTTNTTITVNGVTFDLHELSDDSWSLLAPEGLDCDEMDWPTDEQCSQASGVELEMFDAGDHPTRCEAIMHVVRDGDEKQER